MHMQSCKIHNNLCKTNYLILQDQYIPVVRILQGISVRILKDCCKISNKRTIFLPRYINLQDSYKNLTRLLPRLYTTFLQACARFFYWVCSWKGMLLRVMAVAFTMLLHTRLGESQAPLLVMRWSITISGSSPFRQCWIILLFSSSTHLTRTGKQNSSKCWPPVVGWWYWILAA